MGTGWCLDLSHVPVTLWPCLLLGDLWGILPRVSVPSGWVARAVPSTVRLGREYGRGVGSGLLGCRGLWPEAEWAHWYTSHPPPSVT